MLFRKKREESHEENLLERPDGDNWRDYARMGDAKAEEGDIVSAVDYWSEAVDRFDDDRAKYLGRFCDTVVGKTVSCVVAMAENGEVPPTNLIGDVSLFAVQGEVQVQRATAAVASAVAQARGG